MARTPIDESMDSHNSNVSLEDDESNMRGRFFEQGLSALLSDKHFLLLYVPKNGFKMRVVRPTSDLYHRKRMAKRMEEARGIPSFYYALSHLWGLSENNVHLWHDIGNYVDDENGQPAAPVSMRPEKRDTLLALLRDHPDSYWWIDVLCARTDTPLDIMGDIYACCVECIAMIDCAPDLIPQLHTMPCVTKGDSNTAGKPCSQNNMHHYDDKYSQLIELLSTLMQSQWWKRVWTWQEMALPFGDVRLVAETDTTKQFATNTITVDDLVSRFQAAAFHIMEIGVFSGADNSDSERRCYDPVDYVYGVLGIFQFKVPRMTDPKAVWQRFLVELDHYMEATGIKGESFGGAGGRITGFCDHAYHVDLRKAKKMADVYRYLLEASTCYAHRQIKDLDESNTLAYSCNCDIRCPSLSSTTATLYVLLIAECLPRIGTLWERGNVNKIMAMLHTHYTVLAFVSSYNMRWQQEKHPNIEAPSTMSLKVIRSRDRLLKFLATAEWMASTSEHVEIILIGYGDGNYDGCLDTGSVQRGA
ncbi:hypothetical protein O0I10_009734 [Lichtheimia ornata]|uniref:Heterokaryon incompatibility domain-containing protein n=1 Tax=Lichtheimia ornata TaxID=688661 RepID=A0AAD7UW85_9FUNG|nr:uncharacterized protein O0I10_009734 [Lichtheimia ornata]KAJ8654552.1 hypothetical protein O0I10_009734 [Lichtheimia ornata]